MDYQESEIKFYIRDIKKLADRLRICGADLVRERTLERNLRLDTTDQSLYQEGRILRLRQDDRARVTYKANARIDGGLIARTELEFTVDDFAIAQKLFEELGYHVTVIYEKYRHVYRMGDVEVVLDELPIGIFAELEASNKVLIEGAAQMLGLDWSKGTASSYLSLFENVRSSRGFIFRDLTFDNFQGLEISSEEIGLFPADKQ